MHPLDYFSESPKYFIFQKETNKTNFGGVLTLFFGLIMIFVSILYLLDYIDLDDYSIEYSHIVNMTLIKDIPALNNDPVKNPNITFGLMLKDLDNQPLSDKFFLYDFKTGEKINREINYTYINRKISDLQIGVYYNCTNESNCSLKEEDKPENGTLLEVIYDTPNIDLQNSPSPIKEEELIRQRMQIPLYFNIIYSRMFEWENIIYKEKSTLFNRFFNEKKESISGHIANQYNYVIEQNKEELEYGEKKLLILQFANYHRSYIEYKRKGKTIFDLLAKLTSLFQSIRFGFLFFFKYYSKNFNNYKIIEKVLDMNNKKFREIELNSILYEPTDNNNNHINDKNNNLCSPLINNLNKNNNLNINDTDTDYGTDQNEIDDLLKEKILPKLSFMHFLCNNLYSNKCSKIRSQETLHICNKIILKYMSIDSILFNQMRLENLFKDYNWNNPILNNIEKNDLINKLKTLI